MAFNDDPSRKSTAISISGSSASDEIAFEGALIPVTAATETQERGKIRFQRDQEPVFLKLLFAGTILNRE